MFSYLKGREGVNAERPNNSRGRSLHSLCFRVKVVTTIAARKG